MKQASSVPRVSGLDRFDKVVVIGANLRDNFLHAGYVRATFFVVRHVGVLGAA